MTATLGLKGSARTEGREAKRPPCGGGSGAARFIEPGNLCPISRAYFHASSARPTKTTPTPQNSAIVNKLRRSRDFIDFKTHPSNPLKTLKNSGVFPL